MDTNLRKYLSFQEELLKEGTDWKALTHTALGGAAGGAGVGAGIGALVGAGAGGVQAYRKARQEGGTIGQSLGAGAGGAAGGIGKGLAIGAGVGALGGAATPGTVQRIRDSATAGGALARFGQRQLHGVTGWRPQGGYGALGEAGRNQLRMGAYDAQQALHQAVASGKGVENARKAFDASAKAEGMGLTSLPGYVRAIKEHGLGASTKALGADMWHGNPGVMGKAMAFGLPAAALLNGGGQEAELAQRGAGRGERIGHRIGDTLGGVVGAPLPFVGQEILQRGARTVGRLAGKGVDGVVGAVRRVRAAGDQ